MRLIHDIIVSKHQLTVKINPKLKSYFALDFWFKCDALDLESIPQEILLIPFILNIAPVVWANDLLVELPFIDSNLQRSLAIVKSQFINIYPDLAWNGSIASTKLVASDLEAVDESTITLLFSGGVDSVNASQELINYKQLLVTVRGADIKLDDEIGWDEVKASVHTYASRINAKTFFIESNFTNFLNHNLLAKNIKCIPDWWGNVQHGIGLAGFMALPAWQYGVRGMFMASDFSKAQMQGLQWASLTPIIESASWNNCTVNHASTNITRQEKINKLVSVYRATGRATPLRVCYESRGGKNCSVCRKCSMTMLGLLAASLDYELFGFSMPKHIFAYKMQNDFFKVKYKITKELWQDLINHIKPRSFYQNAGFSSEILDLLEWMQVFDINTHAKATVEYANRKRIFFNFARKIPFLHSGYKAIKAIKAQKF